MRSISQQERAAKEARRSFDSQEVGRKRKAQADARAAKAAHKEEPVRVRLHVSRCARRAGFVQLTLKAAKRCLHHKAADFEASAKQNAPADAQTAVSRAERREAWRLAEP